MYSSEDLERFYFQYKCEAVPQGIPIEKFCLQNNVPYNIFSKWYKDTRKKIVEVQVDGRPSAADSAQESSAGDTITTRPVRLSSGKKKAVNGGGLKKDSSTGLLISVELRLNNGLHVSQRNLSYQDLCRLIENLEVLC